jgi:hypothetical protein
LAFVNAGGMPSLPKASFDGLLNNVISNIDGVMLQIQELQQFMTAHPDADFTVASTNPGPTGYAAGDVANFKSAIADLDQLRTIYQGISSQSTLRGNSNAYDYRTFAKLLISGVH